MANGKFDGRVAVVTGASKGLGKACAVFFAGQGASVLVNDEIRAEKQINALVEDIKRRGGTAVANTNSVLEGHKIIDAAVRAFGSVHILINAASVVPQPKAFGELSVGEWNEYTTREIKGNFVTTKAAWKHFRDQKYGRTVNISSIAALHGLPDQVPYCTTKHSLLGYTSTLAKEGAKNNIFANVVIPWGMSTRFPPYRLVHFADENLSVVQGGADNNFIFNGQSITNLDPENCTAFIGFLSHEMNTTENGGTYEIGGGQVSKLRWQRSGGLLLRADQSLTPDLIVKNWNKITDFDRSDYPNGPKDFLDLLSRGTNLPEDRAPRTISYKGKVVLITGAGSGLGRAYALHFAQLGASIVVNDIRDPSSTVNTIHQSGGRAIAVIASAEEGERIVNEAIQTFGRLDVVINNAGIIRDKAFHNMTESMWDQVLAVHLQGTFGITRAAWPYFMKQKYGRIINTTSVTGIYGSFGQANYGAAKSAIIGLSRALAREGAKHNITVNVIAPNAGTDMTRSILSEESVEALKPDYVAPLLSALCSDAIPTQPAGHVFEVGSGWFGNTRWERQFGWNLTSNDIEDVRAHVSSLGQSPPTHPASAEEHLRLLTKSQRMLDVGEIPETLPVPQTLTNLTCKQHPNRNVLVRIEAAKSASPVETSYSYTERDLILFALSIGTQHTELPLVFEGHKDFHALPVFGLIPFFNAKTPYKMEDIMNNYDQRKLLHVDQFLEIKAPIPRAGVLRTVPKLIQVVDKGKDVMVVQGFTTMDQENNVVFYNETTVLVRGSGGFGGEKVLRDRGAATASNTPPSRPADAVIEEMTEVGQAALYRLNGDPNPLHIDPDFSRNGGFDVPILHGMCSLSIAGKHVYQAYGPYKNLKGRFSSVVIPGQTLRTEMWKEEGKVIFQVSVKETGKRAISAAAVELWS